MGKNSVKLPLKGVLSLFIEDKPDLVGQVSFSGEVEAAEIPSAATGTTVVIHGFDISAGEKPEAVREGAWIRLVLGAEATFNDLLVSDQDMQINLEAAVREFIKREKQPVDGESAPSGAAS